MNATEAPAAVPGECTCLNRFDHCEHCRDVERAAKAEKVRPALEAAKASAEPPPAGADVPAPPPLLIPAKAVSGLIGVSVRTIWRMVEDGRFPRPVKLSRKLVRWNRAAVLAWAERTAGG